MGGARCHGAFADGALTIAWRRRLDRLVQRVRTSGAVLTRDDRGVAEEDGF